MRNNVLKDIVRIVVPLDSQSKEAWLVALGYANTLCEQQPDKFQKVLLLVHTRTQLENTVLATHLGKAQSKALLDGAGIGLPSGAKLTFATNRTLSSNQSRTVIIVYFADDGILEVVDGLVDVAGVVAVPDFPEEASEWCSRWNPFVHGAARSTQDVLVDDPVFAKALEWITSGINLANGALNPRDKSHAEEALRILRAKGHTADPAKIKSWAIKHGWKPSAAVELERLAERILGLASRPSLSKFHNPEGKYQGWRTPMK